MLVSAMTQEPQNALIPAGDQYQAALRSALRLWSEAVTSAATQRRDELLHYKQKIVAAFFAYVGNKHPAEISALDVEQWRQELKGQGLSASTIYSRVCFLSSFYEWALRTPALKEQIKQNPARLALPKAPKPYQTESAKAWTDAEL